MTSPSLRILLLFGAMTLTACADTTQPGVTDSPGATWVTRTPAAGRNTFSSTTQSVAAAPAAPAYTIEQARAECWMKVERDKKAPRDLEKRSKLVETCAGERMAGQPPETR